MSCGTPADPNSPEVEALYPPGSVPQDETQPASAICSFGSTPRLMTGILRQVLIQNFIDPANILDAILRQRLIASGGGWRSTPDSPIIIESLHRWRPDVTEARPAILLNEGEWQWERMGFGDQAGMDVFTGERNFSGFWHGTHTVFALANESAETQNLAMEVARLLLWYGPEIARQMDLHRFVIVSIGALHVLAESTDTFIVPISVAYIVQTSWQLYPEAPRLKRIVFNPQELLAN